MQGEITDDRIMDALMKQEPMTPRVYDLGGDPYYKCHWISCDATVHRWMNYCGQCGQKIDWSEQA